MRLGNKIIELPMYRHFTFKLFTTVKFNESNLGLDKSRLVKAPKSKVDFIKQFARSYENLNLKSCSEHDFVKN